MVEINTRKTTWTHTHTQTYLLDDGLLFILGFPVHCSIIYKVPCWKTKPHFDRKRYVQHYKHHQDSGTSRESVSGIRWHEMMSSQWWWPHDLCRVLGALLACCLLLCVRQQEAKLSSASGAGPWLKSRNASKSLLLFSFQSGIIIYSISS